MPGWMFYEIIAFGEREIYFTTTKKLWNLGNIYPITENAHEMRVMIIEGQEDGFIVKEYPCIVPRVTGLALE